MRVFLVSLSASLSFTHLRIKQVPGGNHLAAPALKTDHLTDCFTCRLRNEASLISQTFSRLHHNSDSSHRHTFIHKPLYKREREESCLGKQREGRSNRQNTLKHSYRHKFGSKNSYRKRVEKSLLDHCNIFPQGPKGPLDTTHRTFLCITNL